jgi:hypothetical protein
MQSNAGAADLDLVRNDHPKQRLTYWLPKLSGS